MRMGEENWTAPENCIRVQGDLGGIASSDTVHIMTG